MANYLVPLPALLDRRCSWIKLTMIAPFNKLITVLRGNLLTVPIFMRGAERNELALPYLGVLGHRNLGDDVLYDLARASFPSFDVLPTGVEFRGQRLLAAACFRRRRGFILGGGTLLLSEQMREVLEPLAAAGHPFLTFGSGALDPDFWGDLPDHAANSWREILQPCKLLGIRGPRTKTILDALGISHARVVGDPAVLFALDEQPRPRDEKVLGVNLGTSYGQVWGRGERTPLDQLADTIRALASNGWQAKFFCVWPTDLPVLHELARRSGVSRPIIVAQYRDPIAFQEQVAGCRVFVGMKLHAVILAACTGVATLALEYQPKLLDFMESIGSGTETVRIDGFTSDFLVDRISDLGMPGSAVGERQRKACLQLKASFLAYIAQANRQMAEWRSDRRVS